MKIQELLDGIRKKDLVLPEFQREYVWTRDQAKQLFVSLYKNYPVGGLLFWKTDEPPELKNLDDLPEKLGTIEVILDGQQRLTTLYMLTVGEIPHYYRTTDISNDPRDLYFHLGEGDFQYYQATRMQGNPLWWRVVDCYGEKIQLFKIAKKVAGDDGDAFELAETYNDNLTRLRQIKNMDLPVQTVPPQATIDEAIDIFDRVNSQGTKLTDAELALTHVTGKWPEARRAMKSKIDELNHQNFYFDLTFMTRALTGVVTHRALFELIHPALKPELTAGWKKLTKILDYLVSVLPKQMQVDSTEDLNTTNVLIPLIVYLAINDGHFPNYDAMQRARHWLYAAHTWSRYTAQTDQRLESDVSMIVRHEVPWAHLREAIVDQRGRIQVKAADMEGRRIRHPLYRMTYILAKSYGAVDWFNGTPLAKTFGKAYKIHNHHIFPSSVLYKSGYDPDNHLHRKIVNEIANRAFITAATNLDLSNTPPIEYLPQVEDKYPGALKKQFIPLDEHLWLPENFEDFLSARRELIARNINEFMEALIATPEPDHERPIEELVTLGESATLEFKSTLQWDVRQKQINKHLRYEALKTVAAFLNSDGGTLIIGVEDDGHVFGLESDLKTVRGRSLDGFEQLLSNLISERIGVRYAHFLSTRFAEVNGNKICAVEVDRASEPAFMSGDRGPEFYVRVGNTSRSLDPQETVDYIQMNWE